MSGDFFRNPLWQNFQDRRIKVFSLSEPEHRLRDARALIELKEFLPPKRLGRCEFKAVTIGGAEIPRLPEIERDEAIVVLGRPTLFGPSAIRMMRRLDPPMLYHFASDDPAQPLEYRTIVRPGRRLHVSEPFSERRRRREKYLKDGAIVYVGWTDKGPLTILCGTSTVGTWGAVRYVTSEVGALDDVRWQQELQ